MPSSSAAHTQRHRTSSPSRRSAPRRSSGPSRTAPPARSSQLDLALAEAQRTEHAVADTFGELGVPDALVATLAAAGISRPTGIQSRTIPAVLDGRDVLGRAETGSGKTLAFGIPMVASLAAAKGAPGPRGLVLVPTRELARQVADAVDPLARRLALRTSVVVGGASMAVQMRELKAGADIVVATPGRLIDLLERRAVSLAHVEIVVLDEADHMADLGFLPAVTRILDETPNSRQALLFSATLDRGVDRLAVRYLKDPAIHAVSSVGATVDTMDHQTFRLRHDDKLAVAAEIAARPARTLFFVRTKHGADRLARQLRTRGIEAGALHGNLNQNQRTRALDSFASGRSRVLVATDVAARGIHVDDVDLVVHFDPPNDHKDYLHRSGRTARAGASGTVIAFVEPQQQRDVAKIHAAAEVSPRSADVHVGHPAVRAIAASGEPIEIRPAAPVASGGSGRSGGSGSARHRPARTPGSPGGGAPARGRRPRRHPRTAA